MVTNKAHCKCIYCGEDYIRNMSVKIESGNLLSLKTAPKQHKPECLGTLWIANLDKR